MISKRIDKNIAIKGSYQKLAEYIAVASNDNEKRRHLWMVNCHSCEGEADLKGAIKEIEATQERNTRSEGNKTYHLIFSFQKGENPSDKDIMDMEAEFAKSLGFADHQRICAVHQNTDNIHVHVAYNQINPHTYNNIVPFQDFPKREKVCRVLEAKYDLQVDLGKADKIEKASLSAKARDYEALTWERSFEGYVQDNKKDILALRDEATSWDDLHKGLNEYGLKIQPRGNGFVIKEKSGKNHMKASSLHRSFSKTNLTDKFGEYTLQKRAVNAVKGKNRYKPTPITKHSKQSALFRRYMGQKARDKGLIHDLYRTWKEFLYAGALNDPLAMAIIYANKKMVELLDITNYSDKKAPPFLKSNSLKHYKIANDNKLQKDLRHEWDKNEKFADAKNHPYFKKYHLANFGVKQDNKGNLLMMARNANGDVADIIKIDNNGEKPIFQHGKDRQGLMHIIDPRKEFEANPIIIAENYHEAAVIHQATGKPVVCAFNAGNVKTVAKALSLKYQNKKRIIIASDYNKVGIHQETAKEVGGEIIKPPFQSFNTVTNFTNLAIKDGRTAIRKHFADILNDKVYQAWNNENNKWANNKNCEYLKNNSISKSYGAKINDKGELLLPGRDVYGNLHDVIKILPDGKIKTTHTGAKAGLMHKIDPQNNFSDQEKPILIVSNYKEAIKAHETKDLPIMCAFTTGNIDSVKASLEKHYPNRKIEVINDIEKLEKSVKKAPKQSSGKKQT